MMLCLLLPNTGNINIDLSLGLRYWLLITNVKGQLRVTKLLH